MTSSNGKRTEIAILGTRGYPSFYGGFETAVRKLVPHLLSRGHKVRVYGRRDECDPMESCPDGLDIRFTSGINSKSLSTLSFGLTSAWDCFLNPPDIALVMNVANGYFLPLLRLRGTRVIVNVDGIEWRRAKWNRFAKLVFVLGAMFTAVFAHELVADSRHIADYWRRVFKRTSTFIPYGGDELPSVASPWDADLGPGTFFLLVCRIVPENSVQLFIDVAYQLNAEVPIVVVGGVSEESTLGRQLRDLSLEKSNVHLLGHLRDQERLGWLWENAGVYFHGHTVGGTNPALVQAMWSRASIVAVDTPFNREVLGEDYEFFVPQQVERTLAVVKGVLESPTRRMGIAESVRSRAETFYGWDQVLQRYEQTLLD